MSMKLTNRQQSILVGTVLGDGYLQKTGSKNARLRLEHCEEQRDYLNWKVEAFSRLFQGKPKHLVRTHPKSEKKYGYWRHQSNASPILGVWRRYFYNKDGIKTIPSDLSIYLTPLALSVWYMDDGYYDRRDRSTQLYLGRVTKRDALNAQRSISEAFGIDAVIKNKKQKGFVLHFSRKAQRDLHAVIRPHLLQLFDYKRFISKSSS